MRESGSLCILLVGESGSLQFMLAMGSSWLCVLLVGKDGSL